jgi:hypothetical protein
MSCSEGHNHPLHRGGTSQPQRLLPALQPAYIRLNEQGFADWIQFAIRFGAYINYYGSNNQVAGTWQPFFEQDISAKLGTLAIQRVDDYQRSVKERFDLLKSPVSPSADIPERKEAMGSLFGGILTLSKALDDYLAKLSSELNLQPTLQNLIQSKLQPALQKLLAYYKAAVDESLITEEDHPEWLIMNHRVEKADAIIHGGGLSMFWIKGTLGWDDYFNGIIADKSIFGDDSWDEARRLTHAANHNLFTSQVDQFLMVYTKAIGEAEKALLKTLTDWSSHQPHYTIFLTFLHLYKYAQEELNRLTSRHLDFYYKEVLRLRPRDAEPNSVHLLVELAKTTPDLLLPKGTLFNAGKDSSNKPASYELVQNTLFNKAKVAQLKSLYSGSAEDNIGTTNNVGRFFAAPVINSADGLGKELENPLSGWHPYINKSYNDDGLASINEPKAQLGFAVASHYLYLTEGSRQVTVRFILAPGSADIPLNTAVECFLSTPKDWFAVPDPVFSSDKAADLVTSCKTLSFTLTGDAPAITNYDPKVHGGAFDCALPILKVYLKNADDSDYDYNTPKDVVLNRIEVDVKVGFYDLHLNTTTPKPFTLTLINNGGLKNLQVSNDLGRIDPSRPFLPFGNIPKKGAALVVGHEEVFKKPGAVISLRAKWAELSQAPSDIDYELSSGSEGSNFAPKASLEYLSEGTWKKRTDVDMIPTDFTDTGTFPSTPLTLFNSGEDASIAYTDPYGPYDIKANKGFLRLVLEGDFGHETYQKDLNAYLVAQGKSPKDTTVANPGSAPYTPKIAALTLHYTAVAIENLNTAVGFASRPARFFHLHPFGEAEQHTALNNGPVSLLPLFNHTEGSTIAQHVGEFYIGLQNLIGGQSVNILFQVLEGTSNPLLGKPEKHVSWSYLARNIWKPFKVHDVSDNTAQLIQSGIISFVIPLDATVDNTLLPSEHLWLRAAVTEKAEAVCKLLSVDAQAALATFKDNGNASDFANIPLAAGTISKLVSPQSGVKKITQPYTAFGGRPVEEALQYYVRISERLRHKSRAITIWDYEHLILEAFPLLHQVKCLSHTRYEDIPGGDTIYSEEAPGHVTIITIPDLQHRNDAAPLRPYTSQNILTQIEAFLAKKISAQVKVHVRHPQFEEVRLDFNLRLMPGLEFNFYSKKLGEEITAFLTPWAFGQATDVPFGGVMHKSVLINFIEERSYVDYITDVMMFQKVDELTPESNDLDEIRATTAKSVLVSAPASKHGIHEIPDSIVNTQAPLCLDIVQGETNNNRFSTHG